MDQEPAPLTTDSVAAYLVDRGVVASDARWTATALSGGVSSVVLDVQADGRRLIVKQPLDRFEVPDEWMVKRERVLVEAEALRIAAEVLPDSVPQVVDLDTERLVVTVTGAPPSLRSWKQDLLAGHARPEVAAELGRLLARWHSGTTDASVLDRFDDPEIFGQQRVDPYYRTTMQRRPELAGAMGRLLDRMLATKACLVHGDFSPKNVLVGEDADDGSGSWGIRKPENRLAPPPDPLVIDWEITHAGDPAFDVAFMTNHLMLKAIHRPDEADAYRRCADAFLEAFGALPDPAYVFGHLGALMVARVDGKSPAEYLGGPQRDTARRVGSSLVADPPSELGTAWGRLTVL